MRKTRTRQPGFAKSALQPYEHVSWSAKVVEALRTAEKPSCLLDAQLFCLLHRTRFRNHIEDPITGVWQACHYPTNMRAMSSTQPRHDDIPKWTGSVNEALHLAAQVCQRFDDLDIRLCQGGNLTIKLPGFSDETYYKVTTPQVVIEKTALGICLMVALVCQHTDFQFTLSARGSSKKIHHMPIIDDNELEHLSSGKTTKTRRRK